MFTFSDIGIFTGSIHDVVTIVSLWIQQKKRSYICVTGAHGVVESSRNEDVLQAHQQAGLVVPDGMPLVWGARLAGYKESSRIYGPDLMIALCLQAEKQRWPIFLYGTTPKTLQRLQVALRKRFPLLKIVGAISPPFGGISASKDRHITQTINRLHPHIVFVGLSTPKQELWMAQHRKLLNAHVLIGVGAAFDFIAGTKKQAPVWMRRSGLEWLFRLTQEPRRLGKRYIEAILIFVSLCVRERWLSIKKYL